MKSRDVAGVDSTAPVDRKVAIVRWLLLAVLAIRKRPTSVAKKIQQEWNGFRLLGQAEYIWPCLLSKDLDDMHRICTGRFTRRPAR